jgi:hypothetical protein
MVHRSSENCFSDDFSILIFGLNLFFFLVQTGDKEGGLTVCAFADGFYSKADRKFYAEIASPSMMSV